MPSELQQCVSDKVGMLIDEGYERDQALAIAYSKCREGKSKDVSDADELADIVKMHGGNLEAVRAHLTEADKMVMRPTQTEVSYVTLSAKKGQACANCRWFHSMGGMFGCHLIENYPEDILPTGRCERWEAKPEMMPQSMTIEAESVTINPAPEMPMGMMALSETAEGTAAKVGRTFNKKNEAFLKQMMDMIKDMLVKAGMMDMPEDEEDMPHKSAFRVFKANGKTYWSAMWSNNFVDREDEILTEKAHEKYIARVHMGLVPMPVLRYWHVPGTEHGKALWIGGEGHMMLAVGDFDDTELARAFVKEYRTHKKKVSHGFRFPTWAKRPVHLTDVNKSIMVYDDYNTFEISPLPPHVAANEITDMEVDIMKVNDELRADLERIIGKATAQGILTKAQEASKSGEEDGRAYKDFADVLSKPEVDSDASATIAKAFLSMIDDQAELAQRQDKLDAANKALTDEQIALKAATEKLVAENADLRERMKMMPRASVADDTKTSDAKLAETMVDRVSEYKEIWLKAGLKVPKETPNNG